MKPSEKLPASLCMEEEGGWALTLQCQAGGREEKGDSRVLSSPWQLGACQTWVNAVLLGAQDMGQCQVGPAPALCPLCPPQPLWAAGQGLALRLCPPFMSQGSAEFSQGSWGSRAGSQTISPVPSLSHSGATSSGTRGERAFLPGATLQSSLGSFPLSAVSLQVLSCSAGPERGSCLLRGNKACLEGEKLFPQFCSSWQSDQGGIFNPFLCC